jgi:hypothetical protein
MHHVAVEFRREGCGTKLSLFQLPSKPTYCEVAWALGYRAGSLREELLSVSEFCFL